MRKLGWRGVAFLVPVSVWACGGTDEPGHTNGNTGGSVANTAGSAPISTAGSSTSTTGGATSNGGTAPAATGGVSAGTSSGGGSNGGASNGGASNGGASNGGALSGVAGTAGVGAGGKPGCVAPAPAADGAGPPETAPSGYGRATTGGGNAAAVSVGSLSALQAAIDSYSGSGGLVLKYTGKFDFASIKDPCVQHTLPAQIVEIKDKSDITILGDAGSGANFGFHIAADSSNIIIRDMKIGLTPGADASDMISIEGMSGGMPKNIWIDHNELFSSLATCPGAGDTAFDGMIDVKKGADNITISYNYMHDHAKVSLNGFSDTDEAVRHVTFHHNLFERIGSRVPLQRHGFSHVVNNYFLDVSTSGINVRMGGYALVEANFFEKVVNPVTARDSDAVGFWELKANNLASAADVAPGNCAGITWTNGDSGTVNATTWTTTAAYPKALGYTYTAQPFQCIHDGLRAVAGSGKGLATLKCK